MIDIPVKYWPFEVLPAAEQTEQHRREISFLETVHGAGYKAFAFAGDSYGVAAPSGRQGEIIRRGRQRWELRLYENDIRAAAAYVGDFPCAGAAALEWLNGSSVDDACNLLRDHLITMPGAADSLVIHHGA